MSSDAARQELLARRLAGRAVIRTDIPRISRDVALPLSSGQRQLWFLHQLDPASPEYLVPVALRIEGELSVPALERALIRLFDRHEILRTLYLLRDGEPVQVVDPVGDWRLPVSGEQDSAPSEAVRAIDLEHEWPLRPQLFRVSDREHLLLALFHHIACDAWSIEVFLRELGELYSESARLAPLPIQYADYAAWERGRTGEHERQLEYWQRRLAGGTVLELPADRPRPAVRDWHGDVVSLALPADLSEGVRELARARESTPSTVLLTAFQVLLSRYTGRTDIAVGTIASVRNRPELRDLIGYGINTLVIRTAWSGLPGFAELLGATRAAVSEAYDQQDVPFAELVDRLQPERDLSRNPLFQVAFSMQDGRDGLLDLPGLRISQVRATSSVSRFDLTLLVEQAADGTLTAAFEYATALFERDTVQRLAHHYVHLLEQVIADQDRPVATLELVTPGERALLLADWQRERGQAQARCPHEVFQERAAAAPDAVALEHAGEQLTYGALNERANRLARRLRGLGIGGGSLVGLCAEPGFDLITGLLAVLKTGAAYLPLDPAQPARRLGYLLADAHADAILAGERQADLIRPLDPAAVLLVMEELGESGPSGDLAIEVDPGDAMYVIYTSGSTGKPKGTTITHGNVTRLFTATDPRFGFGGDDVWTMCHSFAFDVSVWEMWGALLYGGRLLLIPAAVTRSPEDLVELMARHRVTVLSQTPSAFRSLVGLAAAGHAGLDGLSLRLVVFGGERLDLPRLRPWAERFGLDRPALINMYGITETTVHVTYHRVMPRDLADGAPNPIGHPIPDLRLCLLDQQGLLVPLGVPGEIHVGGPGVARGYTGRAALTAQRFVPDPYGQAGERLYRSGDLARRHPDGSLEFLGRIDDQIKIRGYRIEPGEIEAVLGDHPAIRHASVQVRTDTAEPQLVAYWVRREGAVPPRPAQLRELLAHRLPEYMVPAAYVEIDRLPLTVNGKLDRAALPAPGRAALSAAGAYVPPRTELEEQVRVVWSEVLGVARIGVHDGFFELGGDSIRAVAVTGGLREAGWDVTVRDVFEHRTVAELAVIMATREAPAAQAYVEPFALISPEDRAALPEGVADAYPLSRVQAGMIAESLADPELNLYHNVTAYRIPDERSMDVRALRRAINLLVGRHEVLRTGFDVIGYSQPLQLVHESAGIAITLHDLSHLGVGELTAAVTEHTRKEAAEPFADLTRPGLLRIAIHQHLDEDAWWMTITEHHAILEGWSHHTMLMELLACYRELRDGRSPEPVVQPRLRYADFVAAELDALNSREDRLFWQRVVTEHARFELPAEPPGEEARSGARRHERVISYADLQDELSALARSVGAPLKSVLLAAHLKVLSQLTTEPDFFTGLVLHGRPAVTGAEQVYGMFLNTLPFPHSAGTCATWAQRVDQAFAQERRMWQHRLYPMPAIQQAYGRRTRLLDTVFIHLDFHQVDTGWVDYLASVDDSPTEFPLTVQSQLGHLTLATDPALVGPAATDRLAQMYRGVLEAMAADPDGDATETFLPAGERHRLLHELFRPSPETDVPACLHHAFETQALLTPDEVAVSHDGDRLTFGELDARADRLAAKLVEQGAGPEHRVALLLPRGTDLIVAMIATLKAGAAFVPIDPGYPERRIRTLLEIAAPTITIASAALPDGAPYLDVGSAGESALAARDDVTGENLAYMIFTSGSTGVPKGVLITHEGVVDLFRDHRETFYRPAASGGGRLRVAMSSSVAFDASILGLLWMVAGHELHLLTDACRYDPHALLRYVDDQRVDVLDVVTPAYAEQIIAAGLWQRERHPVTLILGGEALSESLQDQLAAAPADAAIYNFYGPTECTVDASRHRWDGRRGQLIGRPNTGTGIYLLDGHLRLVPAGTVGEVYLAGPGLARGYLDQPAVSAGHFLPCPFGPPGTRMYRTGDLGRWTADGELVFCGRADQQIKVRGFRVEPGEIEAALTAHADVEQALVHLDRERSRLIAYVVPAGVDVQELRQHVAGLLPGHMVPAAIMALDSLPLTVTGKLDRAALPAVEFDGGQSGRTPRTPEEERMCELFAEVLGLERIGIDDDFFALGGHSLLAIRLADRIHTAFQVELPLRLVFDHPTVAALTPHLAEPADDLPPEEVEGPGPVEGIAWFARRRPELLPLSSGQQRLWFLNQMYGDAALYTIPSALRLSGDLEVQALEDALGDVVSRHESLRTLLPDVDGQPYQLILPAGQQVMTRHQVNAAELDEVIARLLATPYDLATDLPLRVHLLTLGPREHVLLLLLHHVAGDAGSMRPLARDLAHAYARRRNGLPVDWAPLPAQYADYALWQRDHLAGAADGHARFWQTALRGMPYQLELPADQARPATTAHPCETLAYPVPDEVHRGLLELAAEQHASLYMVLQAAVAALLSRLGAGDDLPIGAAISGRTDPSTEPLVGFFVNMLVIRADTSGDPTFAQLLSRVRSTTLDAFSHQQLPFDQVVELVKPPRNAQYHPLFQTVVNLTGADQPPSLAGLEATPYPTPAAPTQYDLNFTFAEDRGALTGTLAYASDLYDAETADLLTRRLSRLLAEVAADPGRPIGDLDLLTPGERRQYTAAPVVTGQATLGFLHDELGEHLSDEVALVHLGTRLSFRELDVLTNQLARSLRERGIGPEDRVVLLMPRCPAVIVSMIGVLKAGAAFVPIDPSYPAERVDLLVGDCAPALVLTTDAAAVPGRVPYLVLDERGGCAETSAQPPERPLITGLDLENPAYVIYTSGSTGTPKGVTITHAGLTNLYDDHRQHYYEPTVTAAGHGRFRVGMSCSVAFDASILGLMWMLAGHELHLLPDSCRYDPRALVDYVAAREVDVVDVTPSFAEQVLEAGLVKGDYLPAVLVVAGESLGEGLMDRLAEVPDEMSIYNFYGATECTVDTTRFRLNGRRGQIVGRPNENEQIYVLDSQLRPVPTGVLGEIYIAGAGLARGYHDRPALTAKAYLPCPYGEPGSRMYATGDLGRWMPDGNLLYGTRVDDQVKIRGYRIELGEIQAALTSHPGIAQVTVQLREDTPGEKRLVAYAVPRPGQELDPAEVRRHVATSLPEHMVPSAVVVLERIPMNTNGKLDRTALPVPSYSATAASRAPRTHQEQILCDLFGDVLGVTGVGVDDNFFDLGGHSLLATRLAGRIRATLQLELPVHLLFEAPTIAALTQRLNSDDPEAGLRVLLPLRRHGERRPLFCVHPAGGLAWPYARLLHYLRPDQPVYGLQAAAYTDPDAVDRSPEQMAADYLERILEIQQTGPFRLLGWSAGGRIAHHIAVLLQRAGHEVDLLAMLDAPPNADLEMPTLDQLAGDVVADFGLDPAILDTGQQLTIPLLAEVLRGTDSPLADLSEATLRTAFDVYLNQVRIGHEPPTETFKGTLTFFTAALENPTRPHAPSWAPYIDGPIHNYDIPCTHQQIITVDDPLSLLTTVLNQRLT